MEGPIVAFGCGRPQWLTNQQNEQGQRNDPKPHFFGHEFYGASGNAPPNSSLITFPQPGQMFANAAGLGGDFVGIAVDQFAA